MSTSAEPRVLSLFSGAGGLDVGLELAGFGTVGCLEIDQLARSALRTNRPDWPLLLDGNVVRAASELSPSDIGLSVGELDLLAGGPPCQPFSMAAQWSGGRRGMKDERAQTVHALLDLISRFMPRAVLLENVLGFVQGKNSALPEIESRLALLNESGAGYRLFWRLVNAADYGVPQNRKRVILIILRDGLDWQWPEATHEDAPITSGRALAGLPKEGSYPIPKGKWADLLPSVPPGKNYQWFTASGGGPELFGYRTKYWNFLLKLDPDLPSWTLSASPGPSTGPFHWDSRPLTARESMRLQSFPDFWTLPGDLRAQTKLVGNATPPRLAWTLGRAVATTLGYRDRAIDFPLPPAASKTLTIPIAVKVPSRFSQAIGKKTAHPGHGKGPAGADTLAAARPI